MSKVELEDFCWSEDGKFVLQYEKNTGELYISNRKIAYDVRLTSWQNFFAFGGSAAVMIDCLINIFKFFN